MKCHKVASLKAAVYLLSLAFLLAIYNEELYCILFLQTIIHVNPRKLPILDGAFGIIVFFSTLLVLYGVYVVATENFRGIQMFAALLLFITFLDFILNILYEMRYPVGRDIYVLRHSLIAEEFEFHYHCCGLKGPSDYVQRQRDIPTSCYQNKDNSKEEYLHTSGCMYRGLSGVRTIFCMQGFSLGLSVVLGFITSITAIALTTYIQDDFDDGASFLDLY